MIRRLLVANRGEIAVRILRAAGELGIETVAVFSTDDANALHVHRADHAVPLRGAGAAAYLDVEQIIAVARDHDCDAVHPGYGFLSEQARFAERCQAAGITFVGPDAATLALFGDKMAARGLAQEQGVPVAAGGFDAVTAEGAREFLAGLGPGGMMLIKAAGGGGGRGIRIVSDPADVADAYARCRSEAGQAFGDDRLYVEQFLSHVRHVEVQVVGDGSGAVSHLWERECSVQRRQQKLIEIAPSPALTPALRNRLTDAAARMARAVRYRSLGTFEFLVDATDPTDDAPYVFIEANARLQVEHTVTEEVLGVDLVQAQLRLASGEALAAVGLEQAAVPAPRGYAIQVRVNTESIDASGTVRPTGGVLAAFDIPSGRGVRVDTAGYTGYRTNPNFDPLLAKVIGSTPSPRFADAIAVVYRALCELRIEGVRTNVPLLQNVLRHPDFAAGRADTRFVDEHLAELVRGDESHQRLFVEQAPARIGPGARIDAVDPLAVLAYGKSGGAPSPTYAAEPIVDGRQETPVEPGMLAVNAPMQATIVSVDVREGDRVRAGQQLAVLSAMKMEHVIEADEAGTVLHIAVSAGDIVYDGSVLLVLDPHAGEEDAVATSATVDLDHIRPDLAEVERRRAITQDAARRAAVERRHQAGGRSARENVADLCDPGTFVEYGGLAVAQGGRGPVEEQLGYSPGDGFVMGLGRVNSDLFDPSAARCLVGAYDYTVIAGTQSGTNHRKTDRLFQTAEKLRVPLVLFAGGGGGRSGGRGSSTGDGDSTVISGGGGFGIPSWALLGGLSGLVPTVGITSGFCFAGNAALLGCCDVIIATADSNIGMGGPAVIEGGGLGVFRPEEVGPMSVQIPNGVVDIAVRDETEAVRAAKRYLSYFQGPLTGWECADQRLLRTSIPENRLRVYDVRAVIETLADTGSVLELRRDFGTAMITSLIRIEGRAVGVVANNPVHLAGAIDSPAADKAARFMQLCDAYDIPILFLCDTPGIMVGPEVEKTALVRHAARMWVVGSSIAVPTFTIILRKAYGLGAHTMGGGNHKMPVFTVSWPTGEFGGMGLEAAVKLGRRRELEAIDDPLKRRDRYEELVAQAYARGSALNAAHVFEIEDVIDPADSRRWLIAGLEAAPAPVPRDGKKRACVDVW